VVALTGVLCAFTIKRLGAPPVFFCRGIAPSFNGRTAASGAAYRGSNPWGATTSALARTISFTPMPY
jgi:hypothetical protein